jgi:hypothetical protein
MSLLENPRGDDMKLLSSALKSLALLIAGGEPPGRDPWSHLQFPIEPRFLSKAVQSGAFPFYAVSYAPLFYRPCCIAVTEWPEAAQISLRMFVGKLSARGREQLRKEVWPQHGPPPPDLQHWEETGRPDQQQIARFHESLPTSIPLRPENWAVPGGCDGMTVSCWFRWGNRMGATESWQDQEPATFQLARAVYRLATEVLREPTTLEALRVIERCLH